MRNLKRVLSLALAALMLMGMMVVGAGAASKDFTDADEITNVEAVDVMVALGVLEGGDKGDFQPNSILTREQAAKIICYMLLGEEDADKLTTNYSIFSDVPANRWSAPYISYCVNLGILAGDGAGHFYPEGKLTGVAFAKMLMVALGYNADRENYVGNNWEINVSAAAIAAGISPKDLDLSKELSRQDAAQMAFNTLQATMVEYKNDNTIIIGGETIVSTTGKASAVRQSPYADTMGTENLQFAEKYFSDLKKNAVTDAFERPSINWVYGKTDIGTYLNTKLLVEEYTTEVTGKDLYDLIGANIIKDYDLTVAIDGVTDSKVNSAVFTAADMNKNNKSGVGATGNGVLTQVFVDPDKELITVAVINTYLAIADDDYNEKKEQASFDVYGLYEDDGEYIKRTDNNYNNDEKMVIDNEDINVEKVAEGDAYLVTIAGGEIRTLAAAEIVADSEITAFKIGSSVTVDGTKYSYASSAEYDVEVLDKYTGNGTTNLKDVTYNVYLDAYGYAIGVDIVSAPNNYVFITGADDGYSNITNKTIKANAIFVDGTMSTIEVNTDKSDAVANSALVNSWYTYTVDKNGVYTLKNVASSMAPVNGETPSVAQAKNDNVASVIDKKNVSLNGDNANGYNKVYGNDSTVYLTASVKQITATNNQKTVIIDGVDSVTTGVKNANIVAWDDADVASEISSTASAANTSSGTYVLYKSNGYIIAAVVVGEDAAASKNLVYVSSSSVEQESYDKTNDEWTWTRKVILNGEETELKEVSDSLSILNQLKQYGWYQVSLNSDGEVIGYKTAAAALNKTNGNAAEYLTDENYIGLSINEYDTVLFTKAFTNTAPWMRGSTLYVTRANDSGFFVAEDAKIVLFQTNKNKEEVSFEVGADELESIVEKLNKDYDGKFDYTISAIIEDGAATTVIIRDEMNNYEKPDVPAGDEISVDLSDPSNVKVLTTGDVTLDDILVAIEAALDKAGYTVVDKTVDNGGNYVFTAKNDKTGFSTKYTYDPSTQIEVAAQPSTSEEFVEYYDKYEGGDAGFKDWGYLPTAGLSQRVEGSTIYLSGKLTNLAVDPIDSNVLAGLNYQYFSGVTNATTLKNAILNGGFGFTSVEKVGFVGLTVDGDDAVSCVVYGTVNGKTGVYALKHAASGNTATSFQWNGVTVDISGLYF